MSDSDSSKGSKVRVMYVRSNDDNKGENKRSDRRGKKHSNHSVYADRDERRKGQRTRSSASESEESSFSPWKRVTLKGNSVQEEGEIEGKTKVDPALIRRQRAEETRIYGENACQALFQHRPEVIVRSWFLQSVTPRFRDALRWMAANKKAYHVVDEAEMIKVSGTEHHGGVCFLIKKRIPLTVEDYLTQDSTKQNCVLALENVGNPHNLGGIIRSCAHFGVKAILLSDPAVLESGAAVRTAEGGAEFIQPVKANGLPLAIQEFQRAGYTIVTTSSHKGTPLVNATLPSKMVLLLGEERSGLSDTVWQQGSLNLSIGGTGQVESLNVSVATGILLAEWWRQHN